MELIKLHTAKVNQISNQLKNFHESGDKRKIRFFHGSSNSTRIIDKSNNYLIDISSLKQIIRIDQKEKIAVVEPNVSMDKLVTECLKYNLIPKVVMEFPAITCGGGINGAALEASSFKYSQFNDTSSELEVILSNGSIIQASKKNNADLFYGISGSYGSLGLITAITVTLIPAKPFVHITLIPTKTKYIVNEIEKKVHDEINDYIEGIVYNSVDSVLLLGKLSDNTDLPKVSFSKPTDEWFYLYVEKLMKSNATREMIIPLKDYLFRYDRGAFWMGKYAYSFFHTPFNRLTRTLLNPFMKTLVIFKALHKTNLSHKYIVQDFYIPLSKTNDFLNFCNKQVEIFPLWLCPIKSTTTEQLLSPHYLQENMLIDVGVWGPVKNKNNLLKLNQLFEKYVFEIGGRKMFYAETFYDEDFFWRIYNKLKYTNLRKKYYADGIFPNVWEKVNINKNSYKNQKLDKAKIVKTTLQTMVEALISKNS